MIAAAPPQQTQTINEVAERYRRRGYTVHVEPREVPSFLRGYRPDLIAKGPDESVVIEVKAAGTVEPERWRDLAQAIQQEPGWRFEIVVPDPAQQTQEKNRTSSLSDAEVRERLAAADHLAVAGTLDAALLVAWSALEAALRLMGEKYAVELPDDRPGTLITRLYMDGLLDRADYDLLTEALNQRNAVAHGYRRSVLPEDVTRLHEAVERVLAE